MFREYAVEPRAIGSDFTIFNLLMGYFGVERGRLISQFPTRWCKEVYDAAKASDMKPVDQLRLVERMRAAKIDVLTRRGRTYDPDLGGWYNSAVAENAVRPFHAIVVSESVDDHPSVIDMSDFDPTNELMVANAALEVQRTPESLSDVLEPLLLMTNEISFVDPYFEILSPKYHELLRNVFGKLVASNSPVKTIRIHRRYDGNTNDITVIQANASRLLPGVIPASCVLEVYEWQELEGGNDLHDRFLLCDCGGVSVGAGFSTEGADQMALVSLLPKALVQEIKDRFISGSEAYRLAKPILIVDDACNVSTREI